MKKFMSVNVKRLLIAATIAFMIVMVTSVYAATPTAIVQFGTDSIERIYAMDTDIQDNIYVAGYGFGGANGFVRKMDNKGNLIWSVLVPNSSYLNAIVVDKNTGDAYVSGEYRYSSYSDFVVAKVSSTGSVLWTAIEGSPSVNDSGRGITLDKTGNVYVSGSTDSRMPGTSNTIGRGAILIKYSSAGQKLWIKDFSLSYGEQAYNVTCYNDILYVAGRSNIKSQTVSAFNTDGIMLWRTGITGGSVQNGAIAVNASGIYVCGHTLYGFDGSPSIGSMSSSNTDIFVVKYDLSGTKLWSRIYGNVESYWDYAHSVKIDIDNNIYVCGHTRGSLDGQVNLGNYDAYIMKLDSNGTKLYTNQFGTAYTDECYAMALDSLDNIMVAGATGGCFPGQTNYGPLSTINGSDAFVVVYPSETQVTVPNVISQIDTVAETTINNAQLLVGAWDSNYCSSPVNTVISQNPVAGTKVKKGSPVTLTVSLGAAPTYEATATLRILNQKTRLPIAGVTVTTRDKNGIVLQVLTTNSNGTVTLKMPKAGKVWIYEVKTGYTPMLYPDVKVINKGAKNSIVSYMNITPAKTVATVPKKK